MTKEFRDKLYAAKTYKSKAITNDSMFSWGNAFNMKLTEIAALGESRCLGAPELTTQMVKDEHDKVLSAYSSCLFSALVNKKPQHKERSNILKNDACVAGPSLKTSVGNSKKIPFQEVGLEDAKNESFGTSLNSDGHTETPKRHNHLN